jgi:hypothetical protein
MLKKMGSWLREKTVDIVVLMAQIAIAVMARLIDDIEP